MIFIFQDLLIYFSIEYMQISSITLTEKLLPLLSYIAGYSNVKQKTQLFCW